MPNQGLLIGGAFADALNQALKSYQAEKRYQDERADKLKEQEIGNDIRLYTALTDDQKMGSQGGRDLFKRISERGQSPLGLLQNDALEAKPAIMDRGINTDTTSAAGLLASKTTKADPYALDAGFKTKEERAFDKALRLMAARKESGEQWSQKDISEASQRLQKDLDPDVSRAGNFGQISQKVIAAQALKRLALDANGNIQNLTAPQIEELSIGLAKLLGAGQVTDARVAGLVPKSAAGSAENLKSWLLNEPRGTNQQAFIQNIMETLEREESLAGEQMREIQRRRLGAHSGLKRMAPDQYSSILENYGLNADGQSLKKEGGLLQKETPKLDPKVRAQLLDAYRRANAPKSQ